MTTANFTLRQKEDDLFKAWNSHWMDIGKEPLERKFVPDGVGNEMRYNLASRKIIFIAKETNDTGSTWDTRDYLSEGVFYRSRAGKPISATFNNIFRWANFFLNGIEDYRLYETVPRNKDKRINIFSSIGMMNLKKTTGKSWTNTKILANHINSDIEFIGMQISLYEPDIIICCGAGTHSVVHKVFGGVIEKKKFGSCNAFMQPINGKEALVINFFHPQARVKIREQFDILLEIKSGFPTACP